MTVSVYAIVAADKTGFIGYQGEGLPWRLRSDMEHFKKQTMGNAVIMGRATFSTLPRKGLPGRRVFVVTRHPHDRMTADLDSNPNLENVEYCGSALIALTQAMKWAAERQVNVFIAGGESIYKQLLPFVTDIWYTELQVHVFHPPSSKALYFPQLANELWVSDLYNTQRISASEHNEADAEIRYMTRAE